MDIKIEKVILHGFSSAFLLFPVYIISRFLVRLGVIFLSIQ